MARITLIQLAESRGLEKIIVFDGLSHPMVIHPMVHGEPLLTAQPFYYLSQLDAVGHVRFRDGEDPLSGAHLEYLADNYLFEYSRLDPSSRMTSRVTSGRFWTFDHESFYAFADERLTETIALDHMNDPSVRSIKVDEELVSLSGWDLGRDSAQHSLEERIKSLYKLIASKIDVAVDPYEGRAGYIGKLRLIKPGDGLLDYFQAQELEYLSSRGVAAGSDTITLRGLGGAEATIPVERVTCSKQYNPVLLSYYFSGLKDENPIKSFIGFYNVLEYYFGDVATGPSGRSELSQLEAVVSWLTDNVEIQSFVNGLGAKTALAMQAPIKTTSGVDLTGLGGSPSNATCITVAAWLYAIRCAIVHSKKTYKGSSAPSIAPYSQQAANVSIAIPLIRWLSQKCIVKDQATNPIV